jgi:hypothetical protein
MLSSGLHRALPLASVLLVLSACSRAPQIDHTPIPQDAAVSLIGSLTSTLIGELTATIEEQGPAQAIDICAKRAPVVGGELSAGEYSVRRVGSRLRNAENAPTEAERGIMASLTPEAPIYDGEIDGRPVFMKGLFIPGELCLTCHGSEEQIPDEVKTALAERYPGDEATGYAIGDLRGAVIVERNPE